MPDSVEMPAPVRTTMREAASTRRRAAFRSVTRPRIARRGRGALARAGRARRRVRSGSALPLRLRLGLLDAGLEQIERGAGERPHIGLAVGAGRLDGEGALDRTGDREAGMTGSITVP